MNDPAPGEPARPFVSVIDAVCCVYFCAAGKSALLIDTLRMEILIPAEVEEEVLRKRRAGRLATHWPRVRASQYIRTLEKLEFDGTNPEVVAPVARIRGRETMLALSISKDLGEAIVLGHAAHLADQGHEVYVVIDDIGGQRLAHGENV